MTHTLTINGWHPARLNTLLGVHWARRRAIKVADYNIVALYASSHLVKAVPKATGKRRVTLTLTLAPRQRAGDPDAYWKSLLDALVHAQLLIDDNRIWCELSPVQFERGTAKKTVVTLEDIDPPNRTTIDAATH